jgi:hypothetical protein
VTIDLDDKRARVAAMRAAKEAEQQAQAAAAESAALDLELEGVDFVRHPVRAVGDLPAVVLVRCPNAETFARYRDKVAGAAPAMVEATAQLGRASVAYPPEAVFRRMCAAFPGLETMVGTRASNLAAGAAEAAGKG